MVIVSNYLKRKLAFYIYKSVIRFRKIKSASLVAKGLKQAKEIDSAWRRICELAKEETLARSNNKPGIILFRRMIAALAGSALFRKILKIKFFAKVLFAIYGVVLRKLTRDEIQKSNFPTHVNFSEYFLEVYVKQFGNRF